MTPCVQVCMDGACATHVDACKLAELQSQEATHVESEWLFFETDPPCSLQALSERHVLLGTALLAAPVLVFKRGACGECEPCTLKEWTQWVGAQARAEAARALHRFHMPLTYEHLQQSAPVLWPHMISAYGAKRDEGKKASKARAALGRSEKRRVSKCVPPDAVEDACEDENETLLDMGEDNDLMDDEEDDGLGELEGVHPGDEDDGGVDDGAGVDEEDALQPVEDVFGDADDAHAFDDGDDADDDALGSADSGSDDNVSLCEDEDDEQETTRAKKPRRVT